jgi:lipopolysaccharide transport system ATP-binding protein
MSHAISIEGIGKRFRINHAETRRADYHTLRETITRVVTAPIRNLRSGAALGHVEDFWALRDVSFAVSPGEVVGIIGRNGAGKSTLLKILTRITKPTQGRVRMRGRVGSLLEVGTGFHPELTGRENVFLNGSILGMSRTEIQANFDRIVDFSGVEKFIDTPIKRYSSGMKVRLAFAVAAHLDLEILLIDEVLAVGDAEFQRKCLGKMNNVAQSGRTILFVSHNMAAMKSLCRRIVLLEQGRVVVDGDATEVISRYLEGFESETASRDVSYLESERQGTGEVRLQFVRTLSAAGKTVSSIPMGEDLIVQLAVKAFDHVDKVFVSLQLADVNGSILFQVDGQQSQNWSMDLAAGETAVFQCTLPRLMLAPGRYSFNVWVHRVVGRVLMDYLPRILVFDMIPNDVFGTGQLPRGDYLFVQQSDWDVVPVSS